MPLDPAAAPRRPRTRRDVCRLALPCDRVGACERREGGEDGGVEVGADEAVVVDEALLLVVGATQGGAQDLGCVAGHAAARAEEQLEGGVGEQLLGGADGLEALLVLRR